MDGPVKEREQETGMARRPKTLNKLPLLLVFSIILLEWVKWSRFSLLLQFSDSSEIFFLEVFSELLKDNKDKADLIPFFINSSVVEYTILLISWEVY